MNKYLLLGAIFLGLFFGCKKVTDKKKTDNVTSGSEMMKSDIAFVHLDSLLTKYEFYKEQQQTMLKKKDMLEGELGKQANQFQKKAIDFQDKVQRQLLTRRQAEEMQQQLAQEEQGLAVLKDKMSYQLMGDQQVMTTQLYDSIQSYLKEFNKRHNYKLILTTASGTPVLWGDKGLDITDSLINGLNARYKAKK